MLILYYVFSILAVMGAVFVVSCRNPIHSALALVLTLFNIAGLYVLLNATFLAVLQVMVYAGAIMVLFIFVIMLLNLNDAEIKEAKSSIVTQVLLGLSALCSLFAFTFVLQEKYSFMELKDKSFGTLESVGLILFEEYVIPFEMTSVLLTVAVVGALVLAKRSLKQ